MSVGFALRCLRLVAAGVLAALLAACIGHQLLQVLARALPSTPGVSAGAHRVWATFRIVGSGKRSWELSATTVVVASSPYRYEVGRRWHTTTRIQLAPMEGLGRQSDTVDVHYLPSAPGLAVAAPGLSALLWLFVSCVGLPLLYLLLWPSRAWRWFADTLVRMSPLPRRGVHARVPPGAGTARSTGSVRRRRHRRVDG